MTPPLKFARLLIWPCQSRWTRNENHQSSPSRNDESFFPFPFLQGFSEDKLPKIFELNVMNYELLFIIEKLSVQSICTFLLSILTKPFYWVGPCFANLTPVRHVQFYIFNLKLKKRCTKRHVTIELKFYLFHWNTRY